MTAGRDSESSCSNLSHIHCSFGGCNELVEDSSQKATFGGYRRSTRRRLYTTLESQQAADRCPFTTNARRRISPTPPNYSCTLAAAPTRRPFGTQRPGSPPHHPPCTYLQRRHRWRAAFHSSILACSTADPGSTLMWPNWISRHELDAFAECGRLPLSTPFHKQQQR